MEHKFEEKVYYSDTDAYGVVWHGSYLRWMEKGRVLFCDNLGLNLVDLAKNNIVLPVTNLNIRYKSSAKLNDEIVITTKVSKITPLSVQFLQTISHKTTGQTFTSAEVDVVAISETGKLYRRLPEILKNVFTEEIICKD